MLVMHLYFVCNMNKIGRAFFIYILFLTATEAVEFISKFKTSTTTTKWKEPTTTPRWKEQTTKYGYNSPSTTERQKEFLSEGRLKIPTSITLDKEPLRNSSYKKPTTIIKWKQPTTTTKWKQPTTTTKWRQPTTTTKWKQQTTTTKWKQPTTTAKWKQQPTTTKWKQPTTTTKWQKTSSKAIPSARSMSQGRYNNGVVAVASFSGIDSRDGRLSSRPGINIFPPADSSMVKTDNNGNYYLRTVNGKMPMPITITKKGDGVSGTIRILPGSVSVSSSASSSSNSGPVSSVASYNPWPEPVRKSAMNDFYFPPFPTFPTISDPVFDARFPDTSFHTKMLDPFPFIRISEPSFETHIDDPWFNKDKFKQPQQKYNTFTSNWLYPSFNPFFNNYW